MAHSSTSILVVDDEPQIRRLLKVSLAPQHYELTEAGTAAAALKRLAAESFDLIILDLGLPDASGLTVIEAVRKTSAVPIIILSVRGDEDSKVAAFDLGADDYVTKPFGMGELVARIRAALRHRLQEQGANPLLQCGEVSIDLVNREVKRGASVVKLSPTEYNLLRLLAEHQGKILTHQYILKAIWGPAKIDDIQYLRVYIRALRQKLEDRVDQPELIRTETGVGYRLMCAERTAGG
ncbi:MAG TPA: response regulator transcription factor [Stellaceae bacterium]|nr:response regulator transcription factor [Stellaceae bacterium]